MKQLALHTIPELLKTIATVLLSSIALVILAQVIARYVFNSPIIWAEELARFSYVWLVFIASIYVTADRSHIAVALLEQRLSSRVRGILDGLVMVLVAMACGVLCFGSVAWLAGVSGGSSLALGLPTTMYYGVVWTSLCLIGIYALVHGINALIGRSAKEHSSQVDQAIDEGM